MADTLTHSGVAYAGGGSSLGGDSERPPSTSLVARLLEAFFSRPILCLLPLVVLTAVGVYSLRGETEEYQALGVVNVSNTSLLTNLTELRTDQGFSFETPATLTSRAYNELLGTDEFTRRIAEQVALDPVLTATTDADVLEFIRESVVAGPAGTNLVAVAATTADPELSVRLADATIVTFTEWVIEADVSQSSTAQSFFGDLVDEYEVEVETARTELESYLLQNPAIDGQRSTQESFVVARLEDAVDVAEGRYAEAVSNQQAARLATEQARIDVEQRLRLVDAPVSSEPIQTSTRDQALKLAMYVISGLLLTLGLVALRAFLDHSVKSEDGLRAITGRDALAIVPEARW